MKSICLVSHRPSAVWCDFLNRFTRYRVFIMVDDDDCDLAGFVNRYENITFIRMDARSSEANGFCDVNFMVRKKTSGWDKALCHFAMDEKNDDPVWFVEDDVFFHGESTLVDIDNQYEGADLLSKRCGVNKDGARDRWHWHRIDISYEPPYHYGLMCAVRLSGAMLEVIRAYASEHRRLFFMEAMFPTLAAKSGLRHDTPREFNTILWRQEIESVDTRNLFHPIKDVRAHAVFRNAGGLPARP